MLFPFVDRELLQFLGNGKIVYSRVVFIVLILNKLNSLLNAQDIHFHA
jgi:hypothetical protein